MALTNGTRGNDVLISSRAEGDWIAGNGGNDIIFGYLADDRLFGGAGDDQEWGGEGDDLVNGGFGNDGLDGGAGFDILKGGDGNDFLWDADGAQALGGKGNDIVYVNNAGGAVGGAGNDIVGSVVSEGGFVQLKGGAGHDIFAIHGDLATGGLVYLMDFKPGEDLIAPRLTLDGQPIDLFAALDADHNGSVNAFDYDAGGNGLPSEEGMIIGQEGALPIRSQIMTLHVWELHPVDFLL